ncbi:MAG: fumarate reductase [Chloroflexi bacterium RBG_16_50_9]|nr:MAG: fumarate reductase [Chloroflexi bacterium RBG_16_50_9]
MKQLQTEVAVVAGGTAGLAAAIAAAENGARVTVFEKASTTGGTGNMGMGLFAVESRLQRLKQISLTGEEAFKLFMDYTHWRVDARLVKAFIDKSGSTIEWLESMGVEFIEPAAYFQGANFTWHIVKGPTGSFAPQSSAVMMKVMTDRARKLGVNILLQTPAKKILKKEGRVAGVIAEDKSGEEIQADARAVIIATGGFSDNPDMIKKYTGYEWGKDLFSFRIPGLVGDGIRMAWEAGAAEEGINMDMVCGLPEPYGGPGGAAIELATFRQPNLMVNLLGERFMNEEVVANTTFFGHAVARQKNRCAFNIVDEVTKKIYEEKGWDYLTIVFPNTKSGDIEATIKKAQEQGYQNLFIANSLEELASKTGINADNLRKTVDEYNQACETGRDNLFFKKAKYLRSVKQPKFYAAKYVPSGYGTLGGIKINHKTEVMTRNHDVIPGLYAAGTDANTVYDGSYIFILPGNTMGFAVNSGRIAGENAAEYVKSAGK